MQLARGLLSVSRARGIVGRWLSTRAGALLAAAAVLVVLSMTSRLRPTAMDNYVWLADAWLHGKLWLPHFPGAWIDAMPYHGKAWIIEAPAPALLLLPFVAAFGLTTNQTILGVTLGALGAFGFWRLGQQLGLKSRVLALFTGVIVFGTSIAFCATEGAVWFVAHLAAFAFTSLALAELFNDGRGWLVAFWAILAAFSRYPLLLAIPVYPAMIYLRKRRIAPLIGYCWVIGPAILASMAYNYARWGTVQEIGFALWYRIMDERSAGGRPPFDVRNIGMQLHAFLLQGPLVTRTFPWVRADKFGLSLTWTTPALIVALFARKPTAEIMALWTLAILTAVPALLYYDLGGVQLGMRHGLDFLPFLCALMLFALRGQWARRTFTVLAAYSIVFGAYQLFLWETLPL